MKKSAGQPRRGTEENKEENEVTTNIQRRKGQCIEKRRQQQPVRKRGENMEKESRILKIKKEG